MKFVVMENKGRFNSASLHFLKAGVQSCTQTPLWYRVWPSWGHQSSGIQDKYDIRSSSTLLAAVSQNEIDLDSLRVVAGIVKDAEFL